MSLGDIFGRLRRAVVGPPRNPFDPRVRERIALAAFFAWIGLGADGLSSANYGPELGYMALGEHAHLALYLAGSRRVCSGAMPASSPASALSSTTC
jgi:hypothetical protein